MLFENIIFKLHVPAFSELVFWFSECRQNVKALF